MVKRFDTKANPVLSSVIDSLETLLQCSKYNQVGNRIEVYLLGDAIFQLRENKELAEKGFGSCLGKSYGYGSWEVSIIINTISCIEANLTERETAAVILHELGHILNEPDLRVEPTFEYCFIHGIPFNMGLLEKVREENSERIEVFADSYANKHGYGQELISTFYKQNKHFEQKIGYYSTRIKKILSSSLFEGKIMLASRTLAM